MWDAPWHWVILAIIVIALFGYKKMPDAARAMGRSLRIFKTEIKGMTEDDKARDERERTEQNRAPVTPAPLEQSSVTAVPPAVSTPSDAVTTPGATAPPVASAGIPDAQPNRAGTNGYELTKPASGPEQHG